MTARRVEPGPGEVLDRSSAAVEFTFDGKTVAAYEGDTIGSALAAAGIDTLSRSFKYHRPRGLLCCSGRCPNCLVDVDGRPNERACTTDVADGMAVRSQNAWPSLRTDLLAITDKLDRLLPAGFYYKTLIRPRRLWPLYERFLRHAAGLGRVDRERSAAIHPRKRHVHADVVVVGGGAAGCLAALEAAGAGATVVLVDDQPELGGQLTLRSRPVDGDERFAAPSGFEASQRLRDAIAAEDGIEHLARATAIGVYEGGLLAVAQGDDLIRIRHQRLVLATGAAERPMLFDGNDRPGVMLASGVLRLRHHYGVAAGEAIVVVTDDDHGWRAAEEMTLAGLRVSALLDTRRGAVRPDDGALTSAGVEILTGLAPIAVHGHSVADGLVVGTGERRQLLDADVIAIAGRREPQVALLAQAGTPPRYDEAIGEFVPDRLPEGVLVTGDLVDPTRDLPDTAHAVAAGRAAATAEAADEIGAATPAGGGSERPLPAAVAMPDSGRKRFVCLCEDVTVKEIEQAVAEGFEDVETLKRYSTVTMGPCQGKMCAGLATRTHAAVIGASPAASGQTTSRPPVRPVTLAALAGPHLDPIRRTAMHEQHEALGATWMDMGAWKRPLDYGDVAAECAAVRQTAGIIDVSTLGTLDVQGADAGAFLDWLHPNRFSDLRLGRVRYRAMLDDAGIILDDGTVARLGEDRFFVSTTTGNIDAVDQWLRWWLADDDRDVTVTDVTSELAAINLAGPASRTILERIADVDISKEAMPYLAAREGIVAGIPAILLRIGFVGELGYEIHVPADYGAHLWDALMDAGADEGIRPFGVEAQRVLRLEKQHAIVGQDTDALSNPLDAGMGWLAKTDKPDFVGRDAVLSLTTGSRPAPSAGRQVLVGFDVDGAAVPAEGAAVVSAGRGIGRVTSAKWSPTLHRAIGLAWIDEAHAGEGAAITVRLGLGAAGETVPGAVRREPFYDPAGERLRT